MLKKLFGKKPPSQVTISSHSVQFAVPAGQTLLEAALDAGIGFPHDCKVGTCGTCRYRLDEGKIGELNSSARALSGADYQAGFRLGCQTLPKGDLSIWLPALHQDTAPPAQTVAARVARVTPLTHDIVELMLRLEQPLSFVPGQYADLTVGAVPGARSYSFAAPASAAQTTELFFHVRRVPGGAFTEWLFGGPRVDAAVHVKGPQGQFGLRQGEGPLVCIGGGSGLAPLKCMLEQAQRDRCSRPVTLLYGARTQADLYCRTEIARLASDWGAAFRFVPVLSAEPADSDWRGARGLVADFAASLPDLAHSQAYLCGPPPMVDAAQVLLRSLGVAESNIFADRFFDRGCPDVAATLPRVTPELQSSDCIS